VIETLIALLAAHLLADFVLQTRGMVRAKVRWPAMGLHIGTVVGTAVILAGTLNPIIMGVLGTTHLAMDLLKTHVLNSHKPAQSAFRASVPAPSPNSSAAPQAQIVPTASSLVRHRQLIWFAADQLFHIAVIVVLARFVPHAVANGWWGDMPADRQNAYYAALVVLSGAIFAVKVGAVVIEMVLEPYAAEGVGMDTNGNPQGLQGGGMIIGWLERGLAFSFLLIGQPEGVALLIAAKSILRFGDITTSRERAHTEYVIIGTLLSFGWALLAAVVTKAAMQRWV
jgi:hypothetical protein